MAIASPPDQQSPPAPDSPPAASPPAFVPTPPDRSPVPARPPADRRHVTTPAEPDLQHLATSRSAATRSRNCANAFPLNAISTARGRTRSPYKPTDLVCTV